MNKLDERLFLLQKSICQCCVETTKSVGMNYFTNDLPFPIWQPKGKNHAIDIIPWVIGEKYPDKKVLYHYVLKIEADKKTGKTNLWKFSLTYNKNTIKRFIFLILCHDTPKELSKGLQVWDTFEEGFYKKLHKRARVLNTGGFILFSHPNEGKRISFVMHKNKCKEVEFHDREPIDNKYIEHNYSLDNYINW